MKTRQRISWSVLDKYKTSRGIAAFLRKNKITGNPDNVFHCPLANATGWNVNSKYRIRVNDNILAPLTMAQQNFVAEFDSGYYPELQREHSKQSRRVR